MSRFTEALTFQSKTLFGAQSTYDEIMVEKFETISERIKWNKVYHLGTI